MLLAEIHLTILLAKVPATPNAGADPDTGDSDNENDKHNHPLVVVGEPVAAAI